MGMFAYTTARRSFRLSQISGILCLSNHAVSGGVVPYYIMMTQYLHLKNSVWALILPNLVGPFYIAILRTYYRSLPEGLYKPPSWTGRGNVYFLQDCAAALYQQSQQWRYFPCSALERYVPGAFYLWRIRICIRSSICYTGSPMGPALSRRGADSRANGAVSICADGDGSACHAADYVFISVCTKIFLSRGSPLAA